MPKIRRLNSSLNVFIGYKERLRTLKKEQLIILFINGKFQPIGELLISNGSISKATFKTSELFRKALAVSAAGFILIHNHPSGNPTPSIEDDRVTKKLASGGKILGIRLTDHIIFGQDKYFSYYDHKHILL